MAKSKAKSARSVVQRVAEDEYVQEQLRNAVTRLHDAYRRASRQGGQAAEDKKLYLRVREAATSIRNAVGAIEEPPPKPKHRGRKLLALVLTAGGVAYLMRQRSNSGDDPLRGGNSGASDVGSPAAPAPEPAGAPTDS
jgi:hypothetical protein